PGDFCFNTQLFEQSVVKCDLRIKAIELKEGFRRRKNGIGCRGKKISLLVQSQIVGAGIDELVGAVPECANQPARLLQMSPRAAHMINPEPYAFYVVVMSRFR